MSSSPQPAGYQVAVKPCGKFGSIGVDILHIANVAVVDLSNRRGVTDHRHQISMSPRLCPKDAEAVLRILKGDALDEAR